MPQHQSAKKRVRQNNRRRLINIQKRSQMKTAVKNVTAATDKEIAQSELRKTISVLDRMAIDGILHKNRAAHLKSKLTRFVNAMP
ncbi:MAG: 30S ribosomal protein S20 [bacterium]|nr:MAG: 30S ribosomal protein S20 [bacterium]